MPITSFTDLRNPYSQNKLTTVPGVTTGSGYAVIVRLKSIVSYMGGISTSFIPDIPNGLNPYFDTIIDGSVTSVDNPGCQGDPSDPSYTAFFSFDDYVNSDMHTIAQSYLMWEKGQNILYSHENWTHPMLGHLGTVYFSWEIIEVVDEATYNNGAGVPQGQFISQATYGDIPVGTITANPLAASSNGASSVYKTLNVPENQGLDVNNHPGFAGLSVGMGNSTLLFEEPNPSQYNPNLTNPVPAGYPGWFSNNYALPISPQNPLFTEPGAAIINGQPSLLYDWSGYTRGFYIGTYATMGGSSQTMTQYGTYDEDDQRWVPIITEDGSEVNEGMSQSLCAPVDACRNPLALNYDATTTPFFTWLSNNPMPNGTGFQAQHGSLMRDYQDDCAGTTFVMGSGGGSGSESCCIFPLIDPDPGGCTDLSPTSKCGCMDPIAANFNVLATHDCNNFLGGADDTCCEYYHTWKYCGGIGIFSGYLGPQYINLGGNLPPSGSSNTPATNLEFMEYYISQPGSGYTGPFTNGMVPIGTVLQMRSIGSPGNYFCMEYMGPANDTTANLYPSNGDYWNSMSWWNYPPALDGNMNLMVPDSCETCIAPALTSLAVFELCDPNSTADPIWINIINEWAVNPDDEQLNQSAGNPSFSNDIDCSTFSCAQCNQSWLLNGMTVRIHPNAGLGDFGECWTYIGQSNTPVGPGPSWIEGIGSGTSNFLRVDPDDITQLQDINNDCDTCHDGNICTPICTDPSSPSYVSGPWPINACECNGDAIGTQAAGWNNCCAPCDDLCNDPMASNYDPTAVGCCGSGAGIGEPTSVTGMQGCTGSNPNTFSGTQEEFSQWISIQTNGFASAYSPGLGFEDMSNVLFGTPTPSGGCIGPNGGYMHSHGSFNTWFVSDDGMNDGTWVTTPDNWDLYLSYLMTAPCLGIGEFCHVITGVTATTTLSEAEDLMSAFYTALNGDNTVVTINTIGGACECEYSSYGQSNDCCTYMWTCIPQAVAFNMNWPDTVSQNEKAIIQSNWNKKYSGNYDFNPSPINAWIHTEDTGYISPSLEYLNTSLTYSAAGNLGFNKSTVPGNQGWASGKQPKINQARTKDTWRFATDFMDNFTGSGMGSYDSPVNFGNLDKDLSKSYYKVKTNMINVPGSFKNPGSKVITEPIIGGTKITGLYHHIIPTGIIRIREGFEAAFPNTSGKEFKTWRTFIESLLADGLPNKFRNQNWTVISQWVLTYVEDINTLNKNKDEAAPEFTDRSITYLVQSDDDCLCIMDPNGLFSSQDVCETSLLITGTDDDNCCSCVYGCMDPLALNYNPLATCDDGSCLDCDPFILKSCQSSGNSYSFGYMSSVPGCNGTACNATPQVCVNSEALINAWGMLNYGDVVNIFYDDTLNGDLCGMETTEFCYQWVSPTDPEYLTFLSSNTPTTLFVCHPWALPNPGLTLTYTPYDGVSYDTTCNACGETPGCTDPTAMNYNPSATIDDGSCEYCIYGCTDGTTLVDGFPDINGYDSTAVYICDISTTVPVASAVLCPHPCTAGYVYNNYTPCATCDDGSCTKSNYHLWKECNGADRIIVAPGPVWTDMAAQQWFYDQMGQPNPGETIYVNYKPKVCYEYVGTILSPLAYMPISPRPPMVDWVFGGINNTSCETCTCIYGCTDPEFCNYDATATCDDGSCCNLTGCLDPTAFNYCPACCCEGPCIPTVKGCMDPDATNYDPTANIPCDRCCEYIVYGCTNTGAINYDPLATVDDGSCEYLDQCKREIKEFGANLTKKLDVECSFASDVYKEYRKQRYGLSNYCGSDLPDHLHEKELCDWEDSKRPAYLSLTIKVLDTYSYPIIDGEPDWFDPLRPTWTNENCGLTSDVDVDMYFAYDTTSMGIAAIKNQRLAIESWLVDLKGRDIPFGGQIYHTLVFGERWLDWGTSVLTGEWNNSGSCGGINTGCTPGASIDHGLCPCSGSASDAVSLMNVGTQMSVTNHFWSAVAWGNTTSREWYAAMPDTVTNGSLTHLGFPPPLTKREVLSVNFADESAAGKIADGCGPGGMAQPYHIAPGPSLFGTNEWTQATDGSGTLANGSDSKVTDCWKADYDEWITQYNLHLAKGDGYKVTMVIYPAKPIGALSSSLAQTAFPLHALGGVDSGNNDPKDGRYAIGTAPTNDIVDLKRIEEGNPYWDTVNPNQPASHTFGYGGLDNYGWIANVRERQFDAAIFKEDLEKYWDPNKLKCDDSECIVLNVVNQNNVAISDYDIYLDGGFVGKTDEYGRLLFNIPNASVKTNHILNLCLCLITEGNCRQQNIKITVFEECAPECCTDPTGVNCGEYYTPPSPQVFEGCMDPNASNYNPMATVDDGTCEYCDPAMIISETHTNVSADGASDGSITISITNGTSPYTYLWSNGATTQNLTGISGGIYTVTVTDASGCDERLSISINEPTEIYGCVKDDPGLWPNVNGVNQSGVTCVYPCSDDGTTTGVPEGYLYFCYDPDADIADECCLAGCTDLSAGNYSSVVGYDCNLQDISAAGYTQLAGWNSCCEYCVYGCTNPNAGNYDPAATCEDGSCIFYYDCLDASWQVDQVTGQGYTLSNVSGTGTFMDTTCAMGFCDSSYFFYELAQYYSSTTPFDSTEPSGELTMVNDSGNANSMTFLNWSSCPGCNIDPGYSCTIPVGTILGYTFEAPAWAGGNPGSCYTQQQITDFGVGHVFASWADLRDWHNNGTSTSAGPHAICSGVQIPLILAGQDFQTILDVMTTKNLLLSGNDDPFSAAEGDNWMYFVPFIPECNGYSDCECERILENGPGTYPTQVLCETAVDTCCGSDGGVVVYGCIDDGDVMNNPLAQDYFNNSIFAGQTNDDWWIGNNQSGISYGQNNNPMSICDNGIVHEEAIANGGAGQIGSGMTGTYPLNIPAYNFNPLATDDDGSCCYCSGCTDETNINFALGACQEDPSLCVEESWGCTDPNATNYDAAATTDDFTCEFEGCMDSSAANYLTFAINGLTSYPSPFSGVTYGSPSLTSACSGCCITSLDQPFECVGDLPNSSMCFNGAGWSWDQQIYAQPIGGSMATRMELTREYQMSTSFGNSCQTMNLAEQQYDISVLYAWSNATTGELAEDANKWFFWYAEDLQQECMWTQSQIDGLYMNAGWTAPDGTAGFKIGSGSIFGPQIANLYARAAVIWTMSISLDGTKLWEKDVNDGPLKWTDMVTEFYNNHGFDGTTNPDMTGLDRYGVHLITYPMGYVIHVGFSWAECSNGTSMCLPTVGGTHNSCMECQMNEGCTCAC